MTCLVFFIRYNQNKRPALSFHIHPSPEPVSVINDDNEITDSHKKKDLEIYFSAFRRNIIGHQQTFVSPFGKKEIIYSDWTASGRAYGPIEEYIQKTVMPFVANTHTGTTVTGTLMSKAYEESKVIIKEHVNAGSDDVLIFCGSGTTAAINKLQRILGMRIPERLIDYIKKDGLVIDETLHDAVIINENISDYLQVDEDLRPIVFVTHMEHHSNQVSWLETIATVEIIRPDENGNVDLEYFRTLLEKFKYRKNKIAAVTACSNVTGIQTPYHEMAKLIHEYGGLCFVDFACAAPYVHINMHPTEPGEHLDAIYFSPHKFLGGPGTPGVLIFHKKMYTNIIPDQPGGGTVLYSNPWGMHEYTTDIELREDGGTPPLLQAIKAAMCVKLKEEMGVENMLKREEEILQAIFARFSKMQTVDVLEVNNKKRLGIISFMVDGAHHNLIVKLLNDKFGIQTRGGCSCAGTYGHLLLRVGKARSYDILNSIREGNLSGKPGWVRLSVHPTMSNAEIDLIMDAIELTVCHFQDWMKEYAYDPATNEYSFKGIDSKEQDSVGDWFTVSSWK